MNLAGGAALLALGRRVQETAKRGADSADFAAEAGHLARAWERAVRAATAAWEGGDPAEALPNATLFLQGFGHVVLAWVWLDIALGAADSTHPEAPGKVAAMRYFFEYELPKIGARLDVARRVTLCRDVDVAAL